jgi:aminoglycoside 3-N-acetyltransferase
MANQPTFVTKNDLIDACHQNGLAGKALCIHASLRSFGWIEGGAQTVVDGMLASGCTLLVPSFSYVFGVPPPDQRPARNGWDYAAFAGPSDGIDLVYTPDTPLLDVEDMGAIAGAVVNTPGRVRGTHPLNSFTAVGPLAEALVADQTPLDVYAPLVALCRADGDIVLMGVDLTKLTAIHLAEEIAGRTLFRRWANGCNGRPMPVAVGGCSDGFHHLEPHLANLERIVFVGSSRWRIFPAEETIHRAAEAIRNDPWLTHCGDKECNRCNDAVLGGPILSVEEKSDDPIDL